MPFNYYSEQVNQNNNKTRRNIVNIKNNTGTKRVEEYDTEGKLLHEVTKPLNNTQIHKIKNNVFIPGLFKDCNSNCSQRSLLPSQGGKARRKTRRTNRSRN
jgi:hypothetical protein